MNNTLTEAEKDKGKAKETEKGKETDSDKDISKTKAKSQENTTGGNESVGGRDINTGHENTTAVDGENKHTGTIPEKTVPEGRNEGELEERNTGSEKPTGGSKDKVDREGPDNSLNTVEQKKPDVGKPPERKEGSPDTNLEIEKTDITGVVVIKDKGQEGKERKEEQVNGKRDPDKVGPNDTKMRTVIAEGENTVEIFELEMTKNNTIIHDTKDTKKENSTVSSLEPGRKILPTRVNITQYTMYRAGGEEKPREKPTIKEDKTEKDSAEKTKETLEKEREEKEKEKEKEVNQSFTGKGLIQVKCKMISIRFLMVFTLTYCLLPSCRKKLPTCLSPLPWLLPADVWGGA